MSAYKILENFCKVRNIDPYQEVEKLILEKIGVNDFETTDEEDIRKLFDDIQVEPLTSRVRFINQYLDSIGVAYKNNIFRNDFCNIEIDLSPESDKDTIILLAHHDIVNPESDNMNDNSASVAHLLNLINRIKDYNLNKRVVFVITDGEECGGVGSKYLGRQIKEGVFGNVLYALNLELTGFGDQLHIEQREDSILSNLLVEKSNNSIHRMSIPFNDSISLRHAGVDSICIGLLPMPAINERMNGFYPKEWGLCHSIKDKFENAVEADMNMFNDFLFNFIINE